jgi:hypothetical protein
MEQMPGESTETFAGRWRMNRRLSGHSFFILSTLYFLSTIAFNAKPFSFGLDPSKSWVANIYRDYGLEIGRDIVHVFGPLGWLYYPGSMHGHLVMAWTMHAIMSLCLIGGLALLAVATHTYFRTALFVLAFAIFSFGYLNELSIYATVLAFYILDFKLPRYALWIFPVVVSATFFFVKFNLTISLTLILITYVLVGWWRRTLSPPKALAMLATFLGLLAAIGVFCFDSLDSFGNWLAWSAQITAGNSEAMSRPSNLWSRLSALLMLATIIWMTTCIRQKSGSTPALVWGTLIAILFYFEFKHGFVRADIGHIYHFFWFVPVMTASALLLFASRSVYIGVALVVLLGVVGPSLRDTPLRMKIPLKGILAAKSLRQESQKSWDSAVSRSKPENKLTRKEIDIVGAHTVHVVPYDVALLHRTGLRWRPSPFFQLFLARTGRTDAINAAHIQSHEAADYLFWNWNALDGCHPLYIAPASQLAIVTHYAPLLKTNDRLLLRKQAPRTVTRRAISRLRVHWDEPIALPPSEGILLAKLKIRYTLAGKILKALAWTPAVYLEVDGNKKFRFIPSTAAAGLVVNPLPHDLDQFRTWFETGKAGPNCPQTRQIKLEPKLMLPYFEEYIDLEFEELTFGSLSPEA